MDAREIAYDAPRCGCCDRYSTECAADPCDDTKEVPGAWCDLCGQPKTTCTAQRVLFRPDRVVINAPGYTDVRWAQVCQECYDEAEVL